MISLNKHKLLLLTAFIFLLVGENIRAQTATKSGVEIVAHDTTILAWKPTISGEDFKFQVTRFADIMEKGESIKTLDDYVIIMKLFNTFWAGEAYQKQKKYSLNFDKDIVYNFVHLALNVYLNPAIDKLSAQKECESCDYYSPKYDFRIGLSPKGEPFRYKDIYEVTWK